MTFTKAASKSTFKGNPTILQVIPSLKNGGVEIETLEIAEGIIKAGGRAIIAGKMGGSYEGYIPKDLKLIDLPLHTKNPLLIAKNVKSLKQVIKEDGVDILHVRSRAPAWSAYKAAKALNIPYVTTYHAAYRAQNVLKTFYNSIMARGDRVIAISKFIKEHLLQEYKDYKWFDPSNVCLIERGIDLEYFDPSKVTAERLADIRRIWSIPSDHQILVTPGRISRNKGQEILIDAVSLMKKSKLTLILVGSDKGHESYRDHLLRYAASLDLQGRVKWMPPAPDLAAAYYVANVIVCPSLVPEGFGRMMAEAQAMKKPLVTFAHGAARELVQHGETGWLVPPGDAKKLAETLDAALDFDNDSLKIMGEKARNQIESLYSKEFMCSKTIALYNELLEEKSK